jgi:tetratricopeptide (TPR) repeat protein
VSDLYERLQDAVGETYRLENELGGGGMSRVFLAEEVELGRRVVIKVLPPEMAAGVNQDRFRREVQLAASLQHPHIVPLLTAASSGDLLYYVMPYIKGESLRAKLQREGELPVGEAVRILRDVTDALAAAHKEGVVHRDIKPDNVLISGNHAVVTDFGVAKAVTASSGGSSLTSLGVALGTPAYMAPEQAAADPHTDHRADIYGLGALAYEMLCGRPPFVGATPQAVLAAHVSETPDPVTKHRDAVPASLAELVMRCLLKKPADRWQRAEELLPHFESMTTPSGGVTPTGTQPVAAVGAGIDTGHSPARVAGLFGISALAVLGVVYFLMMQLGLPGWVLPVTVGLLAVGLPVILMTGHVERGRVIAQTTGVVRPDLEQGVHGWLTWRWAIVGGSTGFAALVLGTGVYMAMRVLGIGPVGTLVAAGVLEERDRLIVADFENRTGDSTLGASVTEAFRIDLGQSPVLRLVDASDVTPVLQRMNRDPDSPLDRETALEVAEREGIKAVVVGEIGPVGGGYVLSARLVAAADGAQLLGLRETADGDAELIPAIDRLSAKLRERVGESLRTIRANDPLAHVTTGSPEALRKYSQGVRAFDQGDYERAIPLFEETIAIDTAFAMAYRKLAVSLSNTFADLSRTYEAATKAYRHRMRLPELERYQATAYYHWAVEFDPQQVRTNYLNVLDIQPDNLTALNNLALLLNSLNQPEEAEEYALRATEVRTSGTPYVNAIGAQIRQGAFDRADSTLRRFEAAAPGHPSALFLRGQLISAQRDFENAEVHFLGLRERFAARRGPLSGATGFLALLSLARGELAAAERYGRELLSFSEEDNEAADYVNRAINLARGDVQYRDARSRALSLVDDALARYPLETMSPIDRPYLDLAEFYADAGIPERAEPLVDAYEREVDEALRRRVRDDIYEARAAIATAEGQLERAISLVRMAKEERRCTEACGDFDLAHAYDRAGESDSAIVEFERVVSETFLNRVFRDAFALAPTYKRLGELYEERGERDKAIENYNNFVELWNDADPELQDQVRDVRGRIARLIGER